MVLIGEQGGRMDCIIDSVERRMAHARRRSTKFTRKAAVLPSTNVIIIRRII